MSGTIQEKSSPTEEQEQTPSIRQGEPSLEYDEVGLEKLVNSAYEDVDGAAKESVRRADKKIGAGAESFGLDEKTGDAIFTSGGFADRINTLKARIVSLAGETKAKIAKLLEKKSATEHVKELTTMVLPEKDSLETSVANVNSDAELSESKEAEKRALYQQERKVEEERKEKEFNEYLEREIYPALGITKEDEERALAETPEEKKELKQRSFDNIRGSVHGFVGHYSDVGIFDQISSGKDKKKVQEQIVAELWVKYGEKFIEETGLSVLSDEGLEKINQSYDPLSSYGSELLSKSEAIAAEIYSKRKDFEIEGGDSEIKKVAVRAIIDAAEKEYREKKEELAGASEEFRVRQLIAHALRERLGFEETRPTYDHDITEGRFPDNDAYWKKFTREELVAKLKEEAERVKGNHAITINIACENLMQIFHDGEFKAANLLTPEQREKIEGYHGKRYEDRYFDDRNKTEQALGFKEGTPIIYGALANTTGWEGQAGGASGYGDIFLEIEPEDDFSYTEGDSHNIDKSRSGGDKEGGLLSRQLVGEHALISKAINNIDGEIGIEYQGKSGGFTYVEVQMPRLSLDKIKKINVPPFREYAYYKVNERIMDGFSRVPNAEEWKKKLNFIEHK